MAATPAKPSSDRPSNQQTTWRELLQAGTSILAVSGVLMYAILSISYGQFYGPLGVSANDVGLSYLTTLASSVGAAMALILIWLMAALVVATISALLLFLYIFVKALTQEEFRDRLLTEESGDISTLVFVALFAFFWEILRKAYIRAVRKYTLRTTAWSLILLSILLAFYALPRVASDRAEQVQRGHPISQPEFPKLPLTLLAIQAKQASIAPTAEKGKSPALESLASRTKSNPSLLYLGQANSIAVFYDSVTHEAIYIPAASILLRVAN